MPSQHPKQVRFLDEVMSYSSSPPVAPDNFVHTSSPTIKSVPPSLTMNSAPHTPPTTFINYSKHLMPQACLETGILSWNILDDPRSTPGRRHIVSAITFSQPATSPPVSFMQITSPYLPWSIKVFTSSKVPRNYITVEDVLVSLYNSLRKSITADEFNLLPSENDKLRVKRAYESRYRRIRETSAAAGEEERQGGVKRVDFLIGRLQFDGIELMNYKTGEWELMVS